MKPKVCLVMIVKNEAAIIRERLEAVRGEIDGWVIVDTGSEDATREIVPQVLGDLPGRLWTRPWAGFADARTEAVRLAAEQFPGWWALLLDADTVFHATANWRAALTPKKLEDIVQAISCEVHHGSIRYVHPRLLRLGETTWRWRGVLHEYLEIPAGTTMVETSLVWVEHGSGGARSKNPRRYELDAELLRSTREALALDPDGTDSDLLPRYAFYEAQSWKDAGFHQRAIDCYVERAGMGGFGQEVYLSWLNAGELRLAHQSAAQAMADWMRAWAVDPSRAEALVGIASILRTWECWGPAHYFGDLARRTARTSGGMFADQNVRWRADFEVSVSAWYVGQLNEGRDCCELVLADEAVPEAVKERSRANLELYQEAISARAKAALR